MTSPREQIIAYARKVLGEFAATNVWDPAAQLRAVSVQAGDEYAGRFLLELLQNAHDAHPAERHDGRITIRVDADEGEHGVVYVANAGIPFTYESLIGLCKLARSPKHIGEGIGHKGVGFRSILPVCTWPEIYSADLSGTPGNLDGYSFQFANHADLINLTDGDDAIAHRADEEFPPFQLPVPLDTIPDSVRDIADGGHVTIIRLPLDTPEARTAALAQAGKLASGDVPVLLFLERIALLTVECRDRGSVSETTLTRLQVPLVGISSPDVSFAHVELGELGGYTVASAAVASSRLHSAVSTALRANRISNDWDEWDDAKVSLAVPSIGDVNGRMFTFLPMGEKAPSPFAGHLNAPFFTKLDRADLDPDHPLNDLLLDVAAEIALAAALAVSASEIEAAGRWVSDLVCWHGPLRQRLIDASERSGYGAVIERRLVPIEVASEDGPRWASLAETYRWPAPTLEVLTAARAAENDIRLLDSKLGQARMNRWEEIASYLDCPLSPDAENLAELVEHIAANLDRPTPYDDGGVVLHSRRPKKRKEAASKRKARARPATNAATEALWSDLYSDLAVLFGIKTGHVLRGRRLLVDEAGELRATNAPSAKPSEQGGVNQASAFLPPAKDETPVPVPASLRKQLFYLHPAIAERLDASGRGLLVDANLVYGYDIRNLLEHVGSVLARVESDRAHREALRFVFNLEQNGQIPPRFSLVQLRLRVPTVAGSMVRASTVAFGPGWEGLDGADLAIVIEDARDSERTLADLGQRLVNPDSDLVRTGDSVSAWSTFLAKIGVVNGLPTQITSGAMPKLLGGQLNGAELAKRTHVPAPIADQWSRHLAVQSRLNVAYPQTEYLANRKPRWAIGQAIAEQLSDSAREAYARLVMKGLSQWSPDYLTIDWERDRTGIKDRQTIPSPLSAFLATAAWLPAAPRIDQPTFARPDQLWYFPLSSDDAEPSFAPLVNRATRLLLDSNPKALNVLRTAGLGIWSEPTHAARLVRDLGEAAAARAFGDNQRDQFLRAYVRAWSDVANRTDPSRGLTADMHLVLREGSGLTVWRIADLVESSVTVHLARPGEALHLRLLNELELLTLLVDSDLEGARRALVGELGDGVRIVDETSVKVTPTGVVDPGEALNQQLPWMALLVAAAADHGSGLTLEDRVFDDLSFRLRRLRLCKYETLGMSLFDEPTELPATNFGLFGEPDDIDPIVLSPTEISRVAGPALVALGEQVAIAVGYAGLQERLRAAVLELQQGGNDQPDPDDVDLARALRLSAAQVAATRTRLDGGLDSIIRRLYPLLVHWAGREATDLAVEAARVSGVLEELPGALAALGPSLPVSLEVLISAAHEIATGDELRESVGVEFAEFNRTLANLAPEYGPVSHLAAHEQALRQHLALSHRSLCDQVRWARLSEFDARRPQPDWPELRSFDWITIPEAWGTSVDEVTRSVLTDLVAQEVESRLGFVPSAEGRTLPALDTVSAANKARITRSGPALARLARAWASSNRVTLADALTAHDPGTEIAALFDDNGILDFRELSDEDIPVWLDALGRWPTGMIATADPAAVGVTVDQLETAESAATVMRVERERERRIVRIGEQDIDVGPRADNMAALIDVLQSNVNANPAAIAGPNRVSDLGLVLDTRSRGWAGGGGGSWDSMGGLSDEQRQALGFAGEWLAYQWLSRIYPEANESSWVSTNRRRVFAGDPGNDSLGFDFRVERTRQPIMFEVKASRDGPGVFTLTDSEIREARRHARDGRWRLLIVPYVSDPARCRVLRIPNPFEAGAEGLFRAEGDGIRYRYRLDI
ncbi:MAG: DUF3883 domain-containing protein [Acidimicrobiales bacterium]